MKRPLIAACVVVAGAAEAGDRLPENIPVNSYGIDTVCTGVCVDAQSDPRWVEYPVRIEFFNRSLQWTVGADVTLKTAKGGFMTTFNRNGTWVLFKLAPGKYKVTAMMAPGPGGTATATFSPPKKGLRRVQLVFTTPAAD